MINFAMFCKTYSKDLKRFENMLQSFHKFNVENIKMYVSVSEDELNLFKKFETNNIEIITDESYAKNYFATKTKYGFGIGYVNQEICKLSFWETNFCENYLCIDSDVIFIRNFYVSDFMKDEKTPYSVLIMDKDLATEKHYSGFFDDRMKSIKKIFNEVGLLDPRYKTCHGMQCINRFVLESLKKDFMNKKNLHYKDLIEIEPLEFSWYNAWLQKTNIIEIFDVDSFFKTFHTKEEYIFSRIKNITQADLAKAYVGIVLNSNWSKNLNYKNPDFLCKIGYKLVKKLGLWGLKF